jgi:HK97 gp10 family phage protein
MLDAIVRDCDKKGEQILRKLAFEVEGKAKQLAPYDTTALRNSIYTQTSKGEYSDGKNAGFTGIESKVHEKRPDAKTEQLPKPDDNEVFVGPCVEYGIYQEFGTSKMAAQPYLTPAVEAIRAKFENGETYRELCDPKSEDWLI